MEDLEKKIKQLKIFNIVTFILLLLASSYIIYDYSTTTAELRSELNSQTAALSNDINDVVRAVNQNNEVVSNNIATLDQNLVSLDEKLVEVTTILTENIQRLDTATSAQLNSLSGRIESVQEESEEQIRDLQGEIAELDGDFSSFITDLYPAVVSVQTDNAQGSGFFVDDEYIATNFHVVEDANQLQIIKSDGTIQTVQLVGFSENFDIAVLKAPSDNSLELDFADIDDLKAGQKIVAIGNPLGLSFSLSQGVISGFNRRITGFSANFIQTDTPINPGNSGGPMINADGEVIGIATAVASGSNSIGFAIPADEAESIINDIITQSKSN